MAGLRRTWDKDYYEAKAKERIEFGEDSNEKSESFSKTTTAKQEFQRADEDADGPMGSERAFLKPRENKIDLESKVGKIEIVKPSETGAVGPGYFCDVCKCLLKDSMSYLDHINGKKHQHALGFSMRVEKVAVESVKQKLQSMSKRKIENQTNPIIRPSAVDAFESRITSQIIDEESQKKRKKEDIIRRKKEKQELEAEIIDPEIYEIMGFGGFGSSKK